MEALLPLVWFLPLVFMIVCLMPSNFYTYLVPYSRSINNVLSTISHAGLWTRWMPTRALIFVQQCCGVSLAGAATSPPPCPREAPLVLTSTTWPQLLSLVLGISPPAPSPALWTSTTPYLCYPLILAWLRLTGIMHSPIHLGVIISKLKTLGIYVYMY